MQLHHSTTVTPARRPVRYNRRGHPLFAALPIDDQTAVYVESAAEARMLIGQLAEIAEWFDSLEPPPAPVVIRVGTPKTAPVCAKCGHAGPTVDRTGQWLCNNSVLCNQRAERKHAEVTA